MYYLEHPSIKAKHFWHCTVPEVSRRATLPRCIFPSLLIYRFAVDFASLSNLCVFAAIDLIKLAFHCTWKLRLCRHSGTTLAWVALVSPIIFRQYRLASNSSSHGCQLLHINYLQYLESLYLLSSYKILLRLYIVHLWFLTFFVRIPLCSALACPTLALALHHRCSLPFGALIRHRPKAREVKRLPPCSTN
ncbi:uncharacterized protein B0J16DRAFT_41663 [Fusarium flagelliforme]|uniref:uncharacterized protein n=1 Tax=Fusarium flagelliforme TaxID=2675880 RepID=UPI001E8E40D6|nr:uncharacterized protein B0J16DRAFT_41663 [Fusarium flagelliforme]KAH7198586.1 hypothetical protein B0J16DRAFT_41663 [Fusarium flagelliforme]